MMTLTDKLEETLAALESDDLETARNNISDSFEFSDSGSQVMNRTQFITLMHALAMAVPDWAYNTSQVRETNGTVRLKVRITGTQMGELDLRCLGLPVLQPDNTPFALPEQFMEVVFRDGKIVAMHAAPVPGGGFSGLFKQLGVELPPLVAV